MANPPPPYDSITGISRAVMKDNAQETLTNYNGNARPGELVVDLTLNPPPLYVGNNVGQLTLVAGGAGVGVLSTSPIVTLAQLGNAANAAGAKAVISDGNLVAAGNFGAVVGSGGSNVLPVFSNGANWLIG